jgi:hypothetical protein
MITTNNREDKGLLNNLKGESITIMEKHVVVEMSYPSSPFLPKSTSIQQTKNSQNIMSYPSSPISLVNTKKKKKSQL